MKNSARRTFLRDEFFGMTRMATVQRGQVYAPDGRRHVASMLSHMIQTGILRDDQGVLWVGRAGEEEYGWRHFMELFTAFICEPLVLVRHGDHHLGNVHSTTFAKWPDGDAVLEFGGRSWRVTHVEWSRLLPYVLPSEDPGRSRWAGRGSPIVTSCVRRCEMC